MTLVLFACVHNAGRSQMAAAWFNELADPAKARAISAGTAPGTRVHPEVVEVMHEVGVELAHVRPQLLSDELAARARWLITMGCGEACPAIPGLARDDWPLEDPKNKPLERVREIRGEVRARVLAFVRRQAWARAPQAVAPEDLGAVLELLREVKLPTEGVTTFFPAGYVAVRGERGLLGVAGLERYGDVGLLRSLAVAPNVSGVGFGEALVADRLAAAKELGLSALYLLTTTASEFFRRHGFEQIARTQVPAELQQSAEFRELCPSEAACLVRHLG